MWGQSPQRNDLGNTKEAFDAESRQLELELLKLKREASRDDSIPWGQRVEAWVAANRDRFEAQPAPQEPIPVAAQIRSRPDDAIDLSSIEDPSERAMISAHQEIGRALRRDLPEDLAADDYQAWLENWSEQNRALIEQAETATQAHIAEEWRQVRPVIIELPDDPSADDLALADAEEAKARRLLQLQSAHPDFAEFQEALAAEETFFSKLNESIFQARERAARSELDIVIAELE